MIEELLKINEVCKILKISKRTLYHWIEQGKLPCIRLSQKTIRFRTSDIMDIIAKAYQTEEKIKQNPKAEKLANEIIAKILKQ